MKILKEKSREYKGKEYYKFKVNLPEDKIKEAGFREGDELMARVKEGEIRLLKEI